MITQIYKTPFQKSYTFLYPLLGLRKNGISPEQTYMFANNIEETCLTCVYKVTNNEGWKKFEYGTLLNHPLLKNVIPLKDDKKAFIFDLSSFVEDYNNVQKGKYSKLSSLAKKYIIEYYNIKSPMFVYIESFLYPEKYIKRYSELLAISEEDLIEVGELCSRPDLNKEVCPYTISEEALAYSNYLI